MMTMIGSRAGRNRRRNYRRVEDALRSYQDTVRNVGVLEAFLNLLDNARRRRYSFDSAELRPAVRLPNEGELSRPTSTDPVRITRDSESAAAPCASWMIDPVKRRSRKPHERKVGYPKSATHGYARPATPEIRVCGNQEPEVRVYRLPTDIVHL